MSVRAALVLGTFLAFAAVLHGGVYEAGHDFVVNRFTGYYEFVPSDERDYEAATPAGRRPRAGLCLDVARTGG